jgi:hypothetical protein
MAIIDDFKSIHDRCQEMSKPAPPIAKSEGKVSCLLRLWLDQYDWRPLCLSQLQKPEQLP